LPLEGYSSNLRKTDEKILSEKLHPQTFHTGAGGGGCPLHNPQLYIFVGFFYVIRPPEEQNNV
jgi:hypothetical protein